VGIPISQEFKKFIKPVMEEVAEIEGNFSIVSPDNLHFTLMFLGHADPSAIIKKLAEISFKAFNISLKGLGSFDKRIIWAGTVSKELDSLANLIRKQLNSFKADDKPFQSHVTLARIKSLQNIEDLNIVIKKYEHFKFGEMKVDRFILYNSDLSSGKPVYVRIKEFKLVD